MNCTDCQLPCGHPSTNWYPQSSIRFCWAQVMFLLDGYGFLVAGRWPEQKTGYRPQSRQDANIQDTQPASDGKPVLDIKAELDRRIYGWVALYGDGERRFGGLAKFQIKLMFDIDWTRDWHTLSPEARNIVKYLSGSEPKMQNYSDWQKGRHKKEGVLV